MKDLRKAFIRAMIFSILWALNILIGKFLLGEGISPFTLLVQIYFIASIFSGIYVLINKENINKKIPKKAIILLLLVGIIGSGLGISISYIGLESTSTVNYGFLIKTVTVFTLLLAHFYLSNEDLTRGKIGLTALFLIGVYLISTNGQMLIPQQGDLLILLGAFLLAINNIILKKLLQFGVDAYLIAWCRILGALCTCLFFAFLLNVPIFTIEYVGLISIGGVLMSIYTYAINKSISYSSASYLTMISMIVPVFVAIGGILIFDEKMTIVQYVGGLIIIIAGVLLERYKGQTKHL